ncbi:dual specificity protein phosphatase 19-like isoform X5 [Hypomesus transpacificus]|uniref:dual specificity protein phosphatase 19-like isoform X5 n=1 Tax=Hypomesus transpacificus TaxID=137520 RepID=UPI001F07B757|nr:dual specificity protein phosphatase 19-like isoform X5 [Hypomesus transpacificus]
MNSLTCEINGFSKTRLKKQSTRVTTVTGRRLIETLASQDAAHDLDVLRKFKVTHVLNVAYGVANPFPHLLHYRTVTLLDLPDTDITSYFPEGCAFIEEARAEEGVVLVHCNAGVSRSSSMVIGYLMTRERLAFNDAFSQVKAARPSICPNPGFLLQLKNYNPQASTSS